MVVQVVHETLFRTVSQSLDICGLRVLYPSSGRTGMAQPKNHNFSASSALPSPGPSMEGVTPVLAVALRGPHARIRLTSIIGPMDYALAKKTDPCSLTAIFGNAKTGLQIFCPRNVDRANTELVRWFGGRAAEQSSMDVGLPYRLKDDDAGVTGGSCGASLAAGKGRKGKRGGGGGKVLGLHQLAVACSVQNICVVGFMSQHNTQAFYLHPTVPDIHISHD